MNKNKPTHSPIRVALYVCSGCVGCDQATAFMQGWVNGRDDVSLEIITIPEKPEQFVRLGITHTRALEIDGELLAQKVSVDLLTELLRTRLLGPEGYPQAAS